MFAPKANGGDLHEAEIAGDGFVISGSDAVCVLQTVDASFVTVAQGVDVAVDEHLHFSVLAGWDDGDAPAPFHIFADVVGVIAAIGQENARFWTTLHDRSIALVFGHLATGNLGGYGQTAGVDAEMNLGREAIFRAPKALSLSPPLLRRRSDVPERWCC